LRRIYAAPEQTEVMGVDMCKAIVTMASGRKFVFPFDSREEADEFFSDVEDRNWIQDIADDANITVATKYIESIYIESGETE
jgi:hypothetical protein